MADGTSHDDLSQAWREAAVDLGIEVTAPYLLLLTGQHQCIARLEHFGSPEGMVTIALDADDREAVRDEAASRGIYVSQVNPDLYRHYQREVFIEALDDWGWYGTEVERPAWYSGWTGPS